MRKPQIPLSLFFPSCHLHKVQKEDGEPEDAAGSVGALGAEAGSVGVCTRTLLSRRCRKLPPCTSSPSPHPRKRSLRCAPLHMPFCACFSREGAHAPIVYLPLQRVCLLTMIVIVRVPLTQWLADAKHVIMCGVIDIRRALQEAAKNHAFGGYYGTHGLGRTDIHANRS